MPELPEVETTLRGIEPHVGGSVLNKVIVRNPRLRWPVPELALQELVGDKFLSLERRAKYLLLNCAESTILLHLGMSGSLRVLKAGTPATKHDHIDLVVTEKSGKQSVVRLNDPRRFGCCLVLKAPILEHKLLASLGPEPLSDAFTGEHLFRLSRGKKLAIKNFIMDGKVVVGVGNIYASESLFLAGVRPSLAAGKLSKARCILLAATIKDVLAQAIKAGGTTLNDFTNVDGKPGYFAQKLLVYGREAKACETCGTAIRNQTIGQRSTFYCRQCQKF